MTSAVWSPRRLLATLRVAFLIASAALAFAALLLVSWLIYMPIAALLVTPISLLHSFVVSAPPSVLLNSLGAIVLSGSLAVGTVAAVFRVLLARARSRQRLS